MGGGGGGVCVWVWGWEVGGGGVKIHDCLFSTSAESTLVGKLYVLRLVMQNSYVEMN